MAAVSTVECFSPPEGASECPLTRRLHGGYPLARMPSPVDASSVRECRYGAGETLFRAGDAGANLFVIREGSVRVSCSLGDRELTLGLVGPGEFIGEDGLIGDAHATTATALEPTCALLVDALSLEAMVAEDAAIAIQLVRALMAKLRAYQDRVALLARPSAGRLALAIARLTESIGQADPEGTLLPRRLRDLAADVGLDEVTLAEASKTLVKERLLRIKKHGIVVPDLQRMYEFVTIADAAATPNLDAEAMRNRGA